MQRTPNIHEKLFDAQNIFEEKKKTCNTQFFFIYEFLTIEIPDNPQSRHARQLLKDAFEAYRKAAYSPAPAVGR